MADMSVASESMAGYRDACLCGQGLSSERCVLWDVQIADRMALLHSDANTCALLLVASATIGELVCSPAACFCGWLQGCPLIYYQVLVLGRKEDLLRGFLVCA